MIQAILSALIVLVCGFIGCIAGEAFCILLCFTSATGCIVYAINKKNH